MVNQRLNELDAPGPVSSLQQMYDRASLPWPFSNRDPKKRVEAVTVFQPELGDKSKSI